MGSPIDAAKLFERFVCRWRFTLRFQHYAPRRGRKRGPAMLSPSCQINRGQLANAFGVINRHAGIQVKNRAEIKPASGNRKSKSALRLGYAPKR
jgi:hypothetical protein